MATHETTTPSPHFSVAAEAWFADHKRYIKPSTAKSYNDSLRALEPFFGKKPLNEIEIVHVRMYQGIRRGHVSAHTVNREVGVLQQIMREFDEWKRLESRYRQVPQPPQRAGHTLTYQEEQRLRDVAFTKPKWHLAGHCMILMLSTTMGFGELRQLRRRDVDMERGCVTVREGAKNEYRQRTIPLNPAAKESMEWILDRWKKIGGSDDDHYILPHRPRGGERAPHWRKTIPWILTEPTTSMHKAWMGIREAAGIPHFRIYDCRVQAITKLLSDPNVSAQVLEGDRRPRQPKPCGVVIRSNYSTQRKRPSMRWIGVLLPILLNTRAA